MHIIGLGTDIIYKERIYRLVHNFGNKFISKVFSQEEINVANGLSKIKMLSYFAKRWVGKEAAVKALGVGFNAVITPNKISILNNNLGTPYIVFDDKIDVFIKDNLTNAYNTHISISDEKDIAIATVIIEKIIL